MQKLFSLLLATLVLFSCEEDNIDTGGSLFRDIATSNLKTFVDVQAYTTKDTIRTDNNYIQAITLGQYTESNFGTTSSSYFVQPRLTELNPVFLPTTVVDSVRLNIIVFVDGVPVGTASSPIPGTNPGEEYIYRNYGINSLFIKGDLTSEIDFEVHEVTSALGVFSDPKSQEDTVPVGTLLGSKTISNTIQTRETITSGVTSGEVLQPISISLDNTYFKTNLIDNPSLADQASFISAVKGFRISTPSLTSGNGFFLNLSPSSFYIEVHYRDTPTSTEKKSYILDLANSLGTRFINVTTNVGGSIAITADDNSTVLTNNDPKLYLQGLGGSVAKIKLDDTQINQIKTNIIDSGWVVNNARLKLYVDTSVSFTSDFKPEYLFAYIEDDTATPFRSLLDDYFIEFADDVFPAGTITPDFDVLGEFYTINMTEYFKNIVEGRLDASGNPKLNRWLTLGVGNLMGVNSSTGIYSLTDPYFQDRSDNPSRVVIFGNNTALVDAAKKLQLEVSYTK